MDLSLIPGLAQHKTDSYISPKLEVRPCHEKGHLGVFAVKPIAAGELLMLWSGIIVNAQQVEEYSKQSDLVHPVQVEEDLYLFSAMPDDPTDYINHSCDANAGMSGQIGVVAMRDIAAGEEVCYDYAMTDGSPYDEFDCNCGAHNCRHRVTGDDWKLPELWERYEGYFSPYLQRRINALKRINEEEAMLVRGAK